MSVRTRHQLLLAIALAGMGCFPSDAGRTKLTGPYELWGVDIRTDMTLCYALKPSICVQRVPPTVFAVGWDASHIIAKRHPEGNRTVTEYYILDQAKDDPATDPSASVRGPFDSVTFVQQRTRFGVAPTLAFKVIERDLE